MIMGNLMNANTTINQDVESTITAIEPSVGSAKNIQTNVEVNFNITPHERWQQSGDPATESSSVTQDNLTQIPDPVNTTILGDGSCGIHSMMFIIITAHQNQAKTSIQIPNNNTVIQGIRSHPYYRSHPNQLSQDLKKLYADMHNINPPGIDIQLTQTDEYRQVTRPSVNETLILAPEPCIAAGVLRVV